MQISVARVCVSLTAALLISAQQTQAPVGIFESHADIGVTPKAGKVEHDPATSEYRVTGGGANIWGPADAYHFAWKRISGDAALTADVRFVGEGVDPHRKAVLMFRQDLSPGAAYADVAVHGDGLTSLQFRRAADGPTAEVRAADKAPVRLRLERRGNAFTMYTGKPGTELSASEPVTLPLSDPLYVGIGVSAHNAGVLETAIFSNVQIQQSQTQSQSRARPRYRSRIAVWDLASASSTVVFRSDDHFEAPNWSRDGRFLLLNSGGNLYRLPEKIDLGGQYRCNNDHDFSPDGKLIAFSASSPYSRQSQVYVANADGSGVRLLTKQVPSYFHGWSPDGKWLAFVGGRNGKYELFRIGVNGGEEERLTSKGAYDDGPEYSPDGRWIYFNSNRSGGWDIWRMPPDGAGADDAKAQQVTSDEHEDWFPHISPDGRQMIALAFPPGTTGHNDIMDGVVLRIMDVPGRDAKAVKPRVLTKFYGGQGTINVNSWSPDSKKFAYVIYEPVAAQ
jgi:Tol biopolymer transport system component